MKNLKSMNNLLLLVALGLLTFLSACTDPCKDVSCAANETCVDGNCIPDGSSSDEIQVTGFITSDQTWTADKCYVLNGRVVVQSSATLTIEPGTLIKGAAGSGTSASALVIARGGKIMANGTAAAPIIFTAASDNIQIGQLTGTNLGATDNELWGGVIVLGNAPISDANGDTEGQIEGFPASETYGAYGGTNASDNSGNLHYISIRHGGISIGDGNEINGLTLGGVGTGTSIHHVEVAANLDDGIECFGGTVNIDDAIVVYQGDDAIDLDQNYSGTIDNFMVITGNGIGTDEGLEIDGPEGSTYTSGLFTLKNGTLINEGNEGSGADLKSKAQGTIQNCSWQGGWPNGVKVRASFSDTMACTIKNDAYAYMTNIPSTLKIQNSEIVSSSLSLSDFVNGYNGSGGMCFGATEEGALDSKMSQTSWNNTISASATTGADASEFNGWTWAANNGKL